jgi:hypothetical protein
LQAIVPLQRIKNGQEDSVPQANFITAIFGVSAWSNANDIDRFST